MDEVTLWLNKARTYTGISLGLFRFMFGHLRAKLTPQDACFSHFYSSRSAKLSRRAYLHDAPCRCLRTASVCRWNSRVCSFHSSVQWNSRDCQPTCRESSVQVNAGRGQIVDFVEHIRMMYAYRLSEMWLDVEDH